MRAGGPRGRTKRQILGRHYLASPGILARIVEAVGPAAGDFIIEIGPGRGALTFPLADRAGRVAAVEKDPEAVKALRESPRPNLEIIEGDILDIDLLSLVSVRRGGTRSVKLVGNIPYSISSPLLLKVLDERAVFDFAAFLVQKEVAEKICARPGGKHYGPLSIRLQVQFAARIAFAVRPGAFVPPPKVDSAFLTLVKRPGGPVLDNLAAAGYPAGLIEEAAALAGIGRTARPEEISIEGFIGLFRKFRIKPSQG
jgi:16S rRNA (adenine1518-N6/adenine1519-N6)-dimethyltransferase